MARRAFLILLASWGVSAFAQTPEVAVFADVYPTLSWKEGERGSLRWYTLTGDTSPVGFRMILESGNRVLVSQRLQKWPGDADLDTLDEYWIESTGSWRVGKQYLPFGLKSILRETAVGARLDTQLLLQNAPIQIAYVDNGTNRTRGVVGRVGRKAGISFAVGNHFGIQASDMSAFQDASELLDRGRGYGLAVGFDFLLPVGSTTVSGEWVSFRDGETALDGNRDLSDVRVDWFLPGRADKLSVAWGRSWDTAEDFLRFEGEVGVAKKAWLRPYLRFTGDGFRDLGITARVKF